MKQINKTKLEKEIININNKYKYTWDEEGRDILLDEKKKILSEKDKAILQILLIQEIPKELHRKIWLISSGSSFLLKEQKENYKNYLKFYENIEKKGHYFYKYLTRKISHDLYRSNLKEEEVHKLKNILNAFISRNLSLSYCQGYNLITSYLLQATNYNEEESFFLLTKIMEDILPYDYFYFGIGIEVELSLIKILLEKFDNELFNHLERLNSYCYIESKLSMWIISLMICKIDKRVTDFFFDCIFLFSNNNSDNYLSTLYTMIFSILAILRNDLINSEESNSINYIVDNFSDNPISEENFQKIIFYNLISKEKNKFKDKSIFDLRKIAINRIIKDRKFDFKTEENTEEILCEEYFPLCIKEKNLKTTEEFIIYKGKYDLNTHIIEAYYGNEEINSNLIVKESNNENDEMNNKVKNEVMNINKRNDEDKEKIMNKLIIERRKHFCK